ncbi:MAG: alcohol dehydrogenase catalytic domain-containing protein [Lachnospiraceae bacterium]|nr:alcohol dehydrogenase catalytic domain-containing protein [Lachnospiraceae bacterium]
MKQMRVLKNGRLDDPDERKRGKIEVQEVPLRELGPEEVKIKVAYCAICGSDPHILVENVFGWELPFGLGHEISGVVVELGEKATQKGLKVGDRVAGNFLGFCGKCYYCQNGQQQFCPHAEEYNFPGFGEYIIWHESQVYKLPDHISLKKGCLLEPISIITRLMDKVDLKFGMRVAVSGGGPIGLLALQSLKMYGASELTVIEPLASRREIALKYGADHVIDPVKGNLQAEADQITDGLGYDVVIDCSGSVHAVKGLPPITAKGGKLIYGAQYPNDFEMPLNLCKYCYMNEITITGFFVAPYAYPRAIQMLDRYQLDDFTEKVVPLRDIEEAFRVHFSGKYLKVLVKCNDDLE